MIIVKKNFCHFFSKVCWGDVKCPFGNPSISFLLKAGYFRSETENAPTITFPSKKNIQTFRWTRRLQFWQSCQTFWHQKWNNFAQRPKSLSKASSFQRNVLKCSSEHFERSFEKSANFLHLIVQISLLEVQKLIKKTIFLQSSPPIFFCISRLFLWHPDFFCQKTIKNCSNSKTDEQI